MNAAPHRIWRPLRSFLVLICVGSALLAADKSWLADLRFDFDPPDWWSNVSPAEPRSADIPFASEPANHPAPELSIRELRNGSLFYPANSWRLDFRGPSRHSSSLAWISPTDSSAAISTSSQSSFTPFISSGASDSWSSARAAVPDGGPPPPPGNWISNASGTWSNPSNWKDGVIPSGSGAIAHFDTLDITTNVTVTVDTSRIISELDVGDTNGTHRYDIAGSSGQRIIFDSNTSTSVLHQSSTSAGDTISVPLALNNDLLISNASITNPLEITGNIAGNRPTSTPWLITFTGTVNVSGDIAPGSGSNLSLNIQGDVNLSGTNTYTGSTFVTGKLFVKGDNSGATGSVQVSGGGSLLSGIGTVGGNVTIFGGTITGGDTTSVGKLTLTHSLSINASEGGGGTYLANLDGNLSDLLAIGGNLTIGNGTTLSIQGTADGTTTYILATFVGGGLSGAFDFVTGLPTDYALVYTSSDIELVPTAIPEPSTWLGGAAAAAAAIALRMRRRLASRK